MATAKQAYEEARIVYDKRPQHDRHSFYDRKARRTTEYLRFEFGHKQETCVACSGSGYYDHNGSPDCGSCSGTGKSTFRSEKAWKESTAPDFARA